MIVNGGTAPTWSEDGKTIYFQRTLGEIWKVDLDSGEETRLLVKNTNGLPDEEFLWPSVSRDGQIALSYKDRGRPTNLLVDTQGRGKDISLGCMITWSPKNDFIMLYFSLNES